MIGIAKTKNPPFTVILVWKFNRFSRNRVDSVTFKTLLKSKGIRVISINEHLDESPSFVKKIVVDKKEVKLYYNLPMPPDGRKKETVGVLPIDTPSGDRGIRTPDLCDANAALSLLSYIPPKQQDYYSIYID